ncbi:dienelactone hydrolase family protein [Actinospica durhamensis]|uniref:Dienelactone hydrolase family protein n=1 Tax=Actinospica durhamensis TaxID=1508375 RepID=A0A941IP49_9ACTN|nr:dienelactone hydrolase family protein [Actinospica durhamensis]MBR7834719.1 dienelactone hydrolase family protein [Actinospica durhamensis]
MSIERQISYHDLETPLQGYLHLPEHHTAPLPGIVLIHGAGGLDAHPREQAGRYADLGYAVLAVDMFGPVWGTGRENLVAYLKELRDEPDLLVRRVAAGLSALGQCAESDGRFAAVGFCFGGMAALTLARAGLELTAAVSLHGSLATVRPAEAGGVRARLLVCHGARDPHVPMADVAAFSEEMIAADADWRLVVYGRAVHGFTHRDAVPGAPGQIPGVGYDQDADELSFAEAREFLAASFTRVA